MLITAAFFPLLNLSKPLDNDRFNPLGSALPALPPFFLSLLGVILSLYSCSLALCSLLRAW